MGAWWDYLAWFLALHYRFDPEPATPFWEACSREADVSRHEELLRAFEESGPLSATRGQATTCEAPDPLWGPEGIDLILLGQRHKCRLPLPDESRDHWRRRIRSWRSLVARAPAQREVLERTEADPGLPALLGRAFQERGPAFR